MNKVDVSTIKALTFDIFGTVTDWRSTIIQELEQLGQAKGIKANWGKFADAWRWEGYILSMERVNRGELPWMNVDQLHRLMLDELLTRFGVTGLNEAERDHLNRVWHRLKAWPDVIGGLERLRRRYIVAALSNGNVALLVNMAKNAGLPWDCVLSSELAKCYKPAPEVYQVAADLLGLRPNQVMMVAAHKCDLKGAYAIGMKIAFISRPMEHGTQRLAYGGAESKENTDDEPWLDLYANDFDELAEKLGT